jgi:hypothetical protein
VGRTCLVDYACGIALSLPLCCLLLLLRQLLLYLPHPRLLSSLLHHTLSHNHNNTSILRNHFFQSNPINHLLQHQHTILVATPCRP